MEIEKGGREQKQNLWRGGNQLRSSTSDSFLLKARSLVFTSGHTQSITGIACEFQGMQDLRLHPKPETQICMSTVSPGDSHLGLRRHCQSREDAETHL